MARHVRNNKRAGAHPVNLDGAAIMYPGAVYHQQRDLAGAVVTFRRRKWGQNCLRRVELVVLGRLDPSL